MPDTGGDGEEEGEEEDMNIDIGYRMRRPEVYSLYTLPPWQLARTVMVTLISLSLLMNISGHYLFGVTWYRQDSCVWCLCVCVCVCGFCFRSSLSWQLFVVAALCIFRPHS